MFGTFRVTLRQFLNFPVFDNCFPISNVVTLPPCRTQMNLARQWHDKTPRPISEEVSLLNTVLNARNQQQLMQQAMNSVWYGKNTSRATVVRNDKALASRAELNLACRTKWFPTSRYCRTEVEFNSRFERCRHLTTTTRIPFVFSSLFKF